jgi:hypothetical protein
MSDEAIITWRNRLILKVCMGDKSDKYDIKAYLVSESKKKMPLL